jgi:hypothetical protein
MPSDVAHGGGTMPAQAIPAEEIATQAEAGTCGLAVPKQIALSRI